MLYLVPVGVLYCVSKVVVLRLICERSGTSGRTSQPGSLTVFVSPMLCCRAEITSRVGWVLDPSASFCRERLGPLRNNIRVPWHPASSSAIPAMQVDADGACAPASTVIPEGNLLSAVSRLRLDGGSNRRASGEVRLSKT